MEKETPDGFQMTLTEFCTQLSRTDRRVEMIGAFEHTERLAGHLKDTKEGFAESYEAFCNQPM